MAPQEAKYKCREEPQVTRQGAAIFYPLGLWPVAAGGSDGAA